MFGGTFDDHEHDGYVPSNLGIGSGDYIEIQYCLDCGQLQGEFPITPDDVCDALGKQ
jgi:hypothetical protein